MPGLPQQPLLPPTPTRAEARLDPAKLHAWAESFTRAFARLWTTLTYVLNALCKVDTLANRPATPTLDEIFYFADNSKELFVADSGAWQMVGPRRGSATIAASGTSVTVTLSPAEANANYRLGLTTDYDNGGLWYTSKLAGSFVINVKTAAPGGGATVDWSLTRD